MRQLYGAFGPLADRKPIGEVGDLACPWKDYSRRDEYGEIVEVRPAKVQDPYYCYVLYVYKIKFKDGETHVYKTGNCTVKKRTNDETEKI